MVHLQSKERDVPEYIQSDDKNKTAKLVRVPKFSGSIPSCNGT